MPLGSFHRATVPLEVAYGQILSLLSCLAAAFNSLVLLNRVAGSAADGSIAHGSSGFVSYRSAAGLLSFAAA